MPSATLTINVLSDSPSGHVNVTLAMPDGTRTTYGFNINHYGFGNLGLDVLEKVGMLSAGFFTGPVQPLGPDGVMNPVFEASRVVEAAQAGALVSSAAITLSAAQAQAIVDYASSVSRADWDLLGSNCVSFVRGLLDAAGLDPRIGLHFSVADLSGTPVGWTMIRDASTADAARMIADAFAQLFRDVTSYTTALDELRQLGQAAALPDSDRDPDIGIPVSEGGSGPRPGYERTWGTTDTNPDHYRAAGYQLPLVLDLDRDGKVDLLARGESTAFFDGDNDGYREQMGWVGVDPDTITAATPRGQVSDGFLVADFNADGNITDSELALSERTSANDSDLEALRTLLDEDGNGIINSADADFAKLRVWVDADIDGQVDAGELRTLAQRGIASIDVRATGAWEQVNELSAGELAAWGMVAGDVHGGSIGSRSLQVGDLPSGGLLYGITRYTRTDGTTGLAGDVGLRISDFGYRWNETADGNIQFDAEDTSRTRILAETAAATINLADQNLDAVIANAGNDRLDASGWSRVVLLDGRGGTDTLTGGKADDWLSGGTGTDTLYGGNGADVIFVDGPDRVFGGAGFDTVIVARTAGLAFDLTAGSGVEAAIGGDGGDRFDAATAPGGVYLSGAAGDDVLTGGSDADMLDGGAGADTLRGGAGGDILNADRTDLQSGLVRGGAGTDILIVNATAGVVIGLATLEVEAVFGGEAADRVVGDDGNNLLRGNGGGDTLWGGAGFDYADYRERTSAVTLDLRQGGAQAGAGGDSVDGIEGILGGAGNDRLTGDGLDNVLDGGKGHDVLYANEGNDLLYAGSGNDRLVGEQGTDVLYGGAGNDSLYGGDGNDTLWGSGQDDTLDGGAGTDLLLVDRGHGLDLVTGGEGDRLQFQTQISIYELWFQRVGDDLRIFVLGDAQFVRVQDYFAGGAPVIEAVGGLMKIAPAGLLPLLDAMTAAGVPTGSATNPYAVSDAVVAEVDDELALAWLPTGGIGDEDTDLGTSAGNTIVSGSDDHRILALGGNDSVSAGNGEDLILGGSGSDRIAGGNQQDLLFGGSGGDVLFGDASGELGFGDTGSDSLYGGTGQDSLFGGARLVSRRCAAHRPDLERRSGPAPGRCRRPRRGHGRLHRAGQRHRQPAGCGRRRHRRGLGADLTRRPMLTARGPAPRAGCRASRPRAASRAGPRRRGCAFS